MANGSLCIFKGLKLKDPKKTMECINIDGYFVNCVEADDIEYMEVELLEHKKENKPGEIKNITPQKGRSLQASITIPKYVSPFDHKSKNTAGTKIQCVEFPLNISNAITVHKLQ